MTRQQFKVKLNVKYFFEGGGSEDVMWVKVLHHALSAQDRPGLSASMNLRVPTPAKQQPDKCPP